MQEKLVSLSSPPSEVESETIRLFSKHFDEFWANFEELRRTGLPSSFSLERKREGFVDLTSSLSFSRHRAKGFLLDYRKFHLQDERISFFRVCKLLKKHCRSPEFTAVVDRCRENWSKPNIPTLGWHNTITTHDLVESLFNEELFHSGKGQSVLHSMNDIRDALSEDAIVFSAYFVAYQRLLILRNLNWLTEPFRTGGNAFRIPA